VMGAGTDGVNGVYLLCNEVKGERPVWTKAGSPNFKIQWSTKSDWWMIDNVEGSAPYGIANCSDKTVPVQDVGWASYMGGEEPMPHIISRVRSHIIVSDAGTSMVNGLYSPSNEAHGGRPVWKHVEYPNVLNIHWSTETGTWVIEIVGTGLPYEIPNRWDPTPPSDEGWQALQHGIEPMPSIRFVALCSIVLSKASIPEVNGVYVPIDESEGNRPVWSQLGNPNYKIHWSTGGGVWVIRHVHDGVKYWSHMVGCLPGDADYDPTPTSVQWIAFKEGKGEAPDGQPTPTKESSVLGGIDGIRAAFKELEASPTKAGVPPLAIPIAVHPETADPPEAEAREPSLLEYPPSHISSSRDVNYNDTAFEDRVQGIREAIGSPLGLVRPASSSNGSLVSPNARFPNSSTMLPNTSWPEAVRQEIRRQVHVQTFQNSQISKHVVQRFPSNSTLPPSSFVAMPLAGLNTAASLQSLQGLNPSDSKTTLCTVQGGVASPGCSIVTLPHGMVRSSTAGSLVLPSNFQKSPQTAMLSARQRSQSPVRQQSPVGAPPTTMVMTMHPPRAAPTSTSTLRMPMTMHTAPMSGRASGSMSMPMIPPMISASPPNTHRSSAPAFIPRASPRASRMVSMPSAPVLRQITASVPSPVRLTSQPAQFSSVRSASPMRFHSVQLPMAGRPVKQMEQQPVDDGSVTARTETSTASGLWKS